MSEPMESAPPRGTPYRDAAMTYRRAGWNGVLPVPYRIKVLGKNMRGWTGHEGAWPSGADIQAWMDSDRADEGRGNIALRLPAGVIGIDVDTYSGKRGAQTLAARIEAWGPLPDTWSSTSRGDNDPSRIRLFRVPEGLRWPGGITPDIEIIQVSHRYVMVWPSVHPEGRVYRWYRPDGIASTAPPGPDDLAELPEAWIAGLTGGELAEEVHFAELSQQEFNGWIATHSRPEPCRAMARLRDKFLDAMTAGSAHESLRYLLGLVRLAEKGHSGFLEAYGATCAAFLAEATNPSRRGAARPRDEAEREWQRSFTGAVRRVLGNPEVPSREMPPDPCLEPQGIAKLIAPAPGDVVGLRPTGTAPAQAPSHAPLAGPVLSAVGHEEAAGAGDAEGDQTAGEASPVAETPLAERTSWWPRDIAEAIAGGTSEPPPAVLVRGDGKALLYAGKVNGLIGASESGKSWVALQAVAQILRDGGKVLYLDFEDSVGGIVGRLLALGVDKDVLIERFTYADPDESLAALAAADLQEVLAAGPYGGVVVDGANAVMTLFGYNIDSNGDATRFAQIFLKPLARTGAAVIVIDHTGKNQESGSKGSLGAQSKRAMITGCQLKVAMTEPLGYGLIGKMGLTVDKDRAGHVRGCSDKGEFAGVATMSSSHDGKVVKMVIEPSGGRSVEQKRAELPPFRPTVLMAAASKMLSTYDGGLSQTQIEEGISGRAVTIRAAMARLVEEGFAERKPGPRNAFLYHHVRLFRELDDLVPADDEEA